MNIKVALKKENVAIAYPIERFEELFNITYLKELTFADWTVEQWIRNKCRTANKKGKVGHLAKWLGHLHYKDLTEHIIPNIEVRWMHKKIGYGLFASHSFKKWQFIGEYTGLLRRRNLIFIDTNDYCFMYPRKWLTMKSYTIDSQNHGNYTRFINHSDFPNCESLSVFHDGIFHIVFRAIKEISAGEELTYDYGGLYWKRRQKLFPE